MPGFKSSRPYPELYFSLLIKNLNENFRNQLCIRSRTRLLNNSLQFGKGKKYGKKSKRVNDA